MAGVAGLEPATCGFGDRCSTYLSYTPFQAIRFLLSFLVFAYREATEDAYGIDI